MEEQSPEKDSQTVSSVTLNQGRNRNSPSENILFAKQDAEEHVGEETDDSSTAVETKKMSATMVLGRRSMQSSLRLYRVNHQVGDCILLTWFEISTMAKSRNQVKLQLGQFSAEVDSASFCYPNLRTCKFGNFCPFPSVLLFASLNLLELTRGTYSLRSACIVARRRR